MRRRQSWLGWTLSGVASYLGYVPGSDAPARQLAAPSDADIQQLYAELGFDPARPDVAAGARDAAAHGSLSLTLDLSVRFAPLFPALLGLEDPTQQDLGSTGCAWHRGKHSVQVGHRGHVSAPWPFAMPLV